MPAASLFSKPNSTIFSPNPVNCWPRWRARVATGVEALTIQQPLARVANVQRALVGARSELVRAHRDLSNLAQKMDLGVICPEAGELNDGARHLDGVTAITA